MLDPDLRQTADRLIERMGAEAVVYAQKMAAKAVYNGDLFGASSWKRISKAITERLTECSAA